MPHSAADDDFVLGAAIITVATIVFASLVFVTYAVFCAAMRYIAFHVRMQEEANYRFTSSSASIETRDRLLNDIIKRHRHLEARKRQAADGDSTSAQVSQDSIDRDSEILYMLKTLLEVYGIPVWLTNAKLALEDSDGGEDETEARDENGYSFRVWFELWFRDWLRDW